MNEQFGPLQDVESGLRFHEVYRGVVVSNEDPLNKGRLKVYIPGVFDDTWKNNPVLLPWAELIEPIFGGSWTNETEGSLNVETGFCSIPHTSKKVGLGAHVWVMFEQGDHMQPRVFGACQGGAGWLAEHPNQHVFKSDNVRVRIDENPSDERSSCAFDSYNDSCTVTSKMNKEEGMKTRVDVEIWNAEGCALNLIIKGNVNMKIEGNVYEEITGDKHETLIGNLYRKHVGDIHYEHEGDTVIDIEGDEYSKRTGNVSETHSGNYSKMVFGYVKEVSESRMMNVHNGYNLIVGASLKTDVNGLYTVNVNGEMSENVSGLKKSCANKSWNFAKSDVVNASESGNVIEQALGGNIIQKAMSAYRNASSVIVDNTGGTIEHNQSSVNPSSLEFS